MPRRTPSASGRAAWDDLDLVRRAIAHDLDDLRRRFRQHGDHGRLPIGGEAIAFEGAQLVLLVDDPLARDDASQRFDNFRATIQDAAIGFWHGDQWRASNMGPSMGTDIARQRKT
jgi:hypothetical protein